MKSESIKVEIDQGSAWLWFDNPPRNELTPANMEELINIHDSLAIDDQVHVAILGSRIEGYFCNGFQPEIFLGKSLEEHQDIFRLLVRMLKSLYTFPKPHISMINGHAMAGGAVLGLISDYRIAADRGLRYSFSEAMIGLTLPDVLLAILRSVIGGGRHVKKAAMESYAYKPPEALAVGLLDAIYPLEKLKSSCEKFIKRLLRSHLASLKSIKKNLRGELVEKYFSPEQTERDILTLTPFLGPSLEETMERVLKRKRRD